MATRWTSKHTGQKIDDTIDCVSNPNLFDNWYFGNLVDQRGGYVVPPGVTVYESDFTTPAGITDKYYTLTPPNSVSDGYYFFDFNGKTAYVKPNDAVRGYTGEWKYSFDRWRISPSSIVCISGGGLSVLADFQQAILSTALILGQKYTMSVLSTDGRLGQMTFTLQQDVDINYGFGFGFFVVFRENDKYWFRLYGTNEATYLAIKLELGSTQTLAHREGDKWVLNEIPDYGEQLARCQRYQNLIESGAKMLGRTAISNDTAVIALFPLPTTMRAKPVVSGGASVASNYRIYANGVSKTPTAVSVNGICDNGILLALTIPTGLGVMQAVVVEYTGTDVGILDSNL